MLSERLAALLRSLPDHPLLDRIVRGRAWIPLLGVMLVGIVAVQVELLKLNAATGRSIELISSLQSRNDALRARVAAVSDPGRIERLASHMGMSMPGPESITFLRVRSATVRRALAGIHIPDLAAFQAALQVSNVAVTPIPSAAPVPANPGSQGANASAAATTQSPATTTTTGTAGATTAPTGAPAATASATSQPSTAAAPPTTTPATSTPTTTPATNASTAPPATTAAPPPTVP